VEQASDYDLVGELLPLDGGVRPTGATKKRRVSLKVV
jgi:hypothetical protein